MSPCTACRLPAAPATCAAVQLQCLTDFTAWHPQGPPFLWLGACAQTQRCMATGVRSPAAGGTTNSGLGPRPSPGCRATPAKVTPCTSTGEAAIGARAYRVLFAAISLPLATLALVYFINHRYDGAALWNLRRKPGVHALTFLLNFVSFYFLYPSTFNLLEVPPVPPCLLAAGEVAECGAFVVCGGCLPCCG